MQRMSGLDASFLYLETPNMPMHVGLVCVLDPAQGKLPYALVLYIPDDFGQPGAAARVWTSGRPDNGLLGELRDGLTTALQ